MPTSGHDDEKVYEHINTPIKKAKADENLIILDNCDAVVGEGEDRKIVGRFRLEM